MQVQVDIGFVQLVQIAKKLPASQWTKLKQAVEKEKKTSVEMSDLKELLLNAPTFTEEQFAAIENARKQINKWRAK